MVYFMLLGHARLIATLHSTHITYVKKLSDGVATKNLISLPDFKSYEICGIISCQLLGYNIISPIPKNHQDIISYHVYIHIFFGGSISEKILANAVNGALAVDSVR